MRDIMRRYLNTTYVRTLLAEVTADGIVSKPQPMRHGSIRGGVPIRHGALFGARL